MTDPQGTPVSPLLDHFAYAVDDVQHAQACLQGVYSLVKVSGCFLCLEQIPFLVYQASADLGYAFVK